MRGHKRERSPGTWRLYAYGAPDSETGKRPLRTRTVKGGVRAAEDALRAFVAEVEADAPTDPARRTLGQLVEQWYAHVAPGLEPGTRDGYRRKIDLHVLPALGPVLLAELDAARLDGHYRTLLAGGRHRDGGPLAARSVNHVHRIIHTACEQGRRWGWLTRNPAELATPPRVDVDIERNLDPARVARLIDTAPDDLADVALLASASGARAGELCGLRWSDIDWDRAEIDLARRAVRQAGGPIIRPSTKTRKDRTVGLDERALAWLRRRRVRMAERALACGVALAPDAYVFSDAADGCAIPCPARLAQRWSKHKTACGIDIRFHDLRHFHIALALDEGVALARVSRRAGHSRESTTSDIYDHVMRADDHDIAEIVAARLPLRERGTSA